MMSEHGIPEYDLNEKFYIFDSFLISNKHIFERGDDEWDSSKIFFQLSIEHADNSPLTHGAEAFENDRKVNFDYMRDINRRAHYIISPLRARIKFKQKIKHVEVNQDELRVHFESNEYCHIYDKKSFKKIDEIQSDVKEYQIIKQKTLKNVETYKNYYVLQNGDLFCYGSLVELDAIIRDAKTLEEKARIINHGGSPVFIQELGNGDLATTSYKRTFSIFRNYKKIYSISEMHDNDLLGFYFDESTNDLITFSKDNTIKKWQVNFKFNTLEQSNLLNKGYCNDYKDFIFISGNSLNKIDRKSYKIIAVNEQWKSPIVSLVKINENYLAAASFDRKIVIYDTYNLSIIKTLNFFDEKHFFPLLSCRRIDDKYLLFASFVDKTAYLIDDNINAKKVDKNDYKELTIYKEPSKEKHSLVKINENDKGRLFYRNIQWYSEKENIELLFVDEHNDVVCIRDGKMRIKFLKYLENNDD